MRSPRSVTCALVGAVVAGGLQLAALSGTSAGAVDPEAARPAPTAATAPAPAAPALARIVSLRPTPDGGLRVVSDVTLPAADAPRRGVVDGVRARVLLGTADGSVLARTAVPATHVRAELPRVAGATALTGEQVLDPAPVLRVRVPVAADLASVRARVAGEGYAAAYRPPARRAAATAPTRVELPGHPLGPSANRLDIVVLGDGYTAADEAAFTADAARVADDLLARTPFAEHRDLVNVVGVFVPSQQRGADQPPPSATCRDHSTAPGCCPETGTANPTGFVETRYDATYCSFGIQRLLVPADTGAIVADADAGHPGWEQVLLVVNDEEYGGSGGFVATTSTHEAGTEVMAHELGHSLLGLDDEYDTFTPGYAPCSDVPSSQDGPCLANVTDVTDRTRLKWRRWVDPATAVPTTGPQPPDVVGLFEGAHYSPTRWYRSCHDCLMRTLGQPFGPVAAEQLPLRLLADDLGTYGVSLVEPGSVLPPTTDVVVVPPGESVLLGLEVLGTGAGTRTTWTVDGTTVAEDVLPTGPAGLEVVGTEEPQRVSVTVVALPGVLHPDDIDLTREVRTWTVAPSADVPAPGEATGRATGPGRRYVRLPATVDCAAGGLAVRLVQPRREPRVRSVVLEVDGRQELEVGRSAVPGRLRLPLGDGDHEVRATVARRGAGPLATTRSYAAC